MTQNRSLSKAGDSQIRFYTTVGVQELSVNGRTHRFIDVVISYPLQ